MVDPTWFPGFPPTGPTERVGKNPGKEVVVDLGEDLREDPARALPRPHFIYRPNCCQAPIVVYSRRSDSGVRREVRV